MEKAIALIGLPGAGKTYWGRILAEHFQVPFYDLDELIIRETGIGIHEIFAEAGEQAFREIETSVLHSLCSRSPHEAFVLSLGGGTPAYNNNMSIVNKYCRSIYINEKIENIVSRLLADTKHNRPLVNQSNELALFEYINKLLQEREVFYNQAEYMIFSQELSITNFEIIIND